MNGSSSIHWSRSSVEPPLTFTFAGRTDAGRRRDSNQDRFVAISLTQPSGEVTLLAVADGMGGRAGGELASQQAVTDMLHALNQSPPGRPDGEVLADGIIAANKAIYAQAQSALTLQGMGTTLVAVLVRGPQAVVAHVGDSRAYLVRDGAAHRLTADHSWVAEQIRLGDLTEQEAAQSEIRNVLTRSIGVESEVHPDVSGPIALQPGDRLVLCSDGLHGVIDDAGIAAAVRGVEPSVAVQRLIDLANQRGGPDNVTAVVGRLGGERADLPQKHRRAAETAEFPVVVSRSRRGHYVIAGLAVLSLTLLAGLGAVAMRGASSSRTGASPDATGQATLGAVPGGSSGPVHAPVQPTSMFAPVPSLPASAVGLAPGPSASATPASSGSVAAMAGQVYTVKAGDTACAIAAMSKISIQELAVANAVTVAALDRLLVGQILTLPAATGSPPGC